MAERPTNAFLRALEAETFAAMAPHLAPADLQVGQTLCRPDDRMEQVYFPLSAALSVLTSTRAGEQVETSLVGNEGVLGAVEACGSGYSAMTSLVQVDGRALRMPAAAFRRLAVTHQDLWDLAWRMVELQLAESRQSGMCQALHGVEPRLARWLLECFERAGDRSILPLTQEFMAAMLGVQRTTVTAFAAQHQKAGLIRYARGRVQILDHEGLEARACECRRAAQDHRRRAGLEPVTAEVPALRLVAG